MASGFPLIRIACVMMRDIFSVGAGTYFKLHAIWTSLQLMRRAADAGPFR